MDITKIINRNISIITLLLVFMLLIGLASCQVDPEVSTPTPTETKNSTQTKQPSQTRRPTATATPVLSVTGVPTVQTSTTRIEVDPQSLQNVRISFWHPWVDMTSYQVGSMIEKFNQSNEWGIQVDVIPAGGASALYSKVTEAITLGVDPPTVVVAPIETLKEWQYDYENVVDLTDYIHDVTYGLSDQEIADFPYIFWSQDAAGESQLGIPAARTVQVLYYNQTWAQELGFANVPQSIEEFKQQVCAAAAANMADETRDNDGTGGWIVNTDSLVVLSWLYSFGYDNLPENEGQPYLFDDETTAETFRFLKAMIDEGCAWISRNPDPYEYFSNRQALIYSGILENTNTQERYISQSENLDTWTILPYPSDPSGKPVIIASGPSYALLSGSPEEVLAGWILIRYMATAESQIKLVQVNYSLPVSVQAIQSLEVFSRYNPQWALAQSWMPVVRIPPGLSSWRTVRNILEDAAWQYMQPQTKSEDLELILQEFDDMILEVLEERGH